ncbi:MAG: ATP phosphoribosyltransferase [Candidatus Diapherotrites archaeon]|nr:ATP phosphoribosyltransferase [Candidatus Diapherotrites archaeon]
MKLKVALPKGSLQEMSVKLFKRAGYNININGSSYFPTVDDPEIEMVLIRAQEIPRYIEEKVIDFGLTGKDWILETKANVVELGELIYARSGFSKVKWVLAVPNNSPIQNVNDLEGKTIATELVEVTKEYLKKNKVEANVEFSWGATEVKPPELCDAIVEVTETGSSLKANNLRIVETLFESTTRIITNKEAFENPWKQEKMENIMLLLQSALAAESRVGLMMNVDEKNLKGVLAVLPSMKSPTISKLSENGWYDINTIAEEKAVRTLIPKLKKAGACAIVEYPLNKVID